MGSKVRSCKKIGFESTLIHLPEETPEEDLLMQVKELEATIRILMDTLFNYLFPYITIALMVALDKDVDGINS